MTDAFTRHRAILDRAVEANARRGAWSPYTESPSARLHPPGAAEAGAAAFQARLGRAFDLDLPGARGEVAPERSPYTGEALGVRYPVVDVPTAVSRALAAWGPWRLAPAEARVGVCLDLLHRLSTQVFEGAHATQHTAGQPWMTAFAGSGANSLDRGLEALAMAWSALSAVPAAADFARPFGPGAPVALRKSYRCLGVGPAAVVACATYPAWNAWPALTANLAAGNPVILKPHPSCVLPVAMAVQQGRAALDAAGFSPDLLTLVVDPPEGPVALELCRHPDVKIVDFTGSARFGALLEAEVRQARVYTETAGCNFALLDGTDDLDATLSALAHALCLFSSQMCTSPQNIWIPDGGVQTPERRVPVDEVVARLCAAVDAWVARAAPALCGAIQAEATLDQMEALRRAAAAGAGELARHGAPYAHPEHPRARTATPLIVRLGPAGRGLARAERFGPMAFVLTAPSRAAALAEATADAARFGAIASFLWSMDEAFIAEAELQAALAGASLAVNLRRQLPINFTAAFSDFHVTGLNPAGTATLTDAAFIAGRFRVVQSRRELPPGPA